MFWRKKAAAALLALLLPTVMVGCQTADGSASAAVSGQTTTTGTAPGTTTTTATTTTTSTGTTTTTLGGTTTTTAAVTTTTKAPTTTTAPPTTTTTAPQPVTAQTLLARMTTAEKVGQLFLPHLPAEDVTNRLQEYAPAGFILYAPDLQNKTAAQVRQELQDYQQAAKTPLFIAVDEEGGKVVRVSQNPALRAEPFLSPQDLFAEGGFPRIIADTQEKARLLLGLGINLNLAPVADISTSPEDYIYPRTFGQPAAQTAEYIRTVVNTMEAEGLSGSLKHFPGYGGNVDTHLGLAYDDRPYSQFVAEDFLPFIAGIEAGVPSVMISHNIVTCMDLDRPASLSAEVHRVLRETLGFEGVIMTDDLSMGAIKQYAGELDPAVAAVLAGNDLLLTADWEESYAALLAAVQAGQVPMSRIDESVTRILNWKRQKGIIPSV